MQGKRLGFFVAVLGLALAACVPAAPPVPDLATPMPPTGQAPVIPETGAVYTYAALVRELTDAGLEPVPAGNLHQPFFDVSARVLQVNGEDIQVFEFPDEQTRQAAEDSISATADVIGNFQPQWVGIPNFWSRGPLLVLYIGQDRFTMAGLEQVLGEPVRVGQAFLPVTGLQAQRFLANALGIDISRVQLLALEMTDWPDACLGLPAEGEFCAQVITPGFQLSFQVDDRQYEVRTDSTGSVVRLVEQTR